MNAQWKAFWFGLIGLLLGALIVWQAVPARVTDNSWPVVRVVHQVKDSVVVVLNNRRVGGKEQPRGIGSGVVLNRQGDIVTNYHVVAGADSVTVILTNGQRYPAQIVGTDPPTDLAVLRIHPTRPLSPIVFARSSAIQPGELVVAIGNSLGLTHTVTVGVISATNRVLYRDGWEYRLIQTDAAINPGNSGGPLVNTAGQLIGINSSKIAQAGVEGIGFAIPSDTVRYVVHELIQFGHVRRPWLGIEVQPVTGSPGGLLVVRVAPNGPASRAGVLPGDFIMTVNGVRVLNRQDLLRVIEQKTVGGTVTANLLRGNTPVHVTIRLGATPAKMASGQPMV